jgi:predicted amidohydrolase YtcJ
MRLVAAVEKESTRDDADLLGAAVRTLLEKGVTMVHDFEGADAMRLLRAQVEQDLRIRVLMHVPHPALDSAVALGIESGLGNDSFRIGGVKIFSDGTLGSRTAAMLEPYDGTKESGEDLLSPRELAEAVHAAHRAGLAVAIHAIGDRAVRSSLDAIEAASGHASRPRLPSRIEHIQILDPADVPRFRQLGVAASMQPSHCVTDIPLAKRYWSSRRERTYPWRTLSQAGALLAFGSDAPVEPPDPGEGLRSALTRSAPEGEAWEAQECLDLDAALVAYTEGPARVAGLWPRLGTLDDGALADVAVWDSDLHALRSEAFAGLAPRWVVQDGRLVHERKPDRVGAMS